MVQVLVECGADVNARGRYGAAPLCYALWGQGPNFTNLELVRWLLNHGADPNVRDEDGETSLHAALRFGMLEMARLLVEHGASVKVKDGKGRTPLHYVSGEQRDEIIKLHSAKRENCCIM